MNKAEELKQKLIEYVEDDSLVFNGMLDEYAQQVSIEAFNSGWKSAWKEDNKQHIAELSYNDRKSKTVKKYFDEWESNQEEYYSE